MTIGILQADHVRPDLLPIAGEYPGMVQALLKTADPDLGYRVFKAVDGEFPASPAECDGYIVTGGQASAYDPDPWIGKLLSFVRQCHKSKKKLMGVCLGHQVIALALGGTVEEATQGWGMGVKSVIVEKQLPWMVPARTRVSYLFTHKDQVIDLPPHAVRIGTNSHCPNNMFILGDHLLAMQGHPEFNHAYARALIEVRREILDDTSYREAINSLSQPTDNPVFAEWMVRFLKHSPRSRARRSRS